MVTMVGIMLNGEQAQKIKLGSIDYPTAFNINSLQINFKE